MRPFISFRLCAVLGLACTSPPGESVMLDGPPADLKASARELYSQYETAIRAPRPEALAAFYHVDGALRIINGATTRSSRAQLDTMYRTRWTPPAFFAWEELSYDSLDIRTVLVTGGFRWTAAGTADTMRYLYAAVLQAIDSGMAIRFEHETLRPTH